MSSPITPLSARVVAHREEVKDTTASGLFLPDAAKEKPAYAVVDAVASDVKAIKTGDKILFKEYSATELTVDGTEYLVLEEKDILGTLK